MTSPIFHLAVATEWEHAIASGGPYTRSTIDRSLEDEGFIHCSFADQVQAVADTFYTGRSTIILLIIDPTGLDVREEQRFPHIYQPLPIKSVMTTTPVKLDGEGRLEVSSLVSDRSPENL